MTMPERTDQHGLKARHIAFELPQRLETLCRSGTEAAAFYGETRLPLRAPPPALSEKRHYCPVCARWSRSFARFGLYGGRRRQCPRCFSLERHRFLWLHLSAGLGLPHRRARILHIAPEPGIARRLTSAPCLDYLAIDLHAPDAPLRMDLADLALPSASFDIAICSHVLEHVPDDRAAIAELHRVLRPGGALVVLVPVEPDRAETFEDARITGPDARRRAFGHPYHVRIYGLDYGDRLRDCGFAVADVWSHSALPGHRRRQMRINRQVLYDCRRP